MRPRVELTIDELELDGFEKPADAAGLLAAQLQRRLGEEATEQLGSRLEPLAVAIAKTAERGVSR
jgi:hypothetical protein